MKLTRTDEVTFQKMEYWVSTVLSRLHNHGPLKCVKACKRHSGCDAVNYKRRALECELLEAPAPDDRILTDDSYWFASKSHWNLHEDACWPNPCPTEMKCVITRNKTHVCVKVGVPVKPKDCSELPGGSNSRVYRIYPDPISNGVKVYCDMDTDGGNWTVFQRRQDGSVDFYKAWHAYRDGFGDVATDYWMGNENLHTLTKNGNYQLRVDLQDWDDIKKYALYNVFSVGDETTKYKLNVGGYSGNAGDSLASHNNMKFTTMNNDNDRASYNCAYRRHGGWWYNDCFTANMNAIYQPHVTNRRSVSWNSFRGPDYSLKKAQMMMRKK